MSASQKQFAILAGMGPIDGLCADVVEQLEITEENP
jgi:hypothetical protein